MKILLLGMVIALSVVAVSGFGFDRSRGYRGGGYGDRHGGHRGRYGGEHGGRNKGRYGRRGLFSDFFRRGSLFGKDGGYFDSDYGRKDRYGGHGSDYGRHGDFRYGQGDYYGRRHGGESYGQDDDRHYGRKSVKDADRAQDYYSENSRLGDRDAYKRDSDYGKKYGAKHGSHAAKESKHQDYVNFDNEHRDKSHYSTKLSFNEDYGKDKGAKTSYSAGRKIGDRYLAEKNHDNYGQKYDSDKVAAKSETVKDYNKDDKKAYERVYDKDSEYKDEGHNRHYEEDGYGY